MESRRTSRVVIDPKVRKVGFFTSGPPPPPDRSYSGPPGPSNNSLAPVWIPPSNAFAVPVPNTSNNTTSLLRRRASFDNEAVVVGSYNPPDSVLRTSPVMSSPFTNAIVGDTEFSDDSVSWIRRSNSGKFSSSLPGGGFFNLTMVAPPKSADFKKVDGGSTNEKSGGPVAEAPKELPSISKPLKEKTTKAERRAMQEAQRAAKAPAKAEGNKSFAASGGVASVHEQTGKSVKQSSQKRDGPPGASSTAVSEKKGGDRLLDKDRKKDVPPPRMQFDDKNRVEKAKRRAVVKQTEARNRVELFRHLPQYEPGTQLPDLEAKFFQLDAVHPSVYTVGLHYLAGDITGSNARCISMLQAFRESIRDYSTPPERAIDRDLTAKLNSNISFLIECRPLSISMGNAIRFLKARIAKLPLTLSESDAKASLCSDIDRFIDEKIILADKVIVRHAVTKIRDGDVLLTYGSSSIVEMTLLYAHEHGKQFRVVVVDSRPKLEGQALLRRLVKNGLSCTYTHINAVSYIMHEVTRVFLGAASVLSNGTVCSRVGTACVAMVAHSFRVPVLVCCEAYKFHERVQLDSICSNELGDPDAISKVPGRRDASYSDNGASKENLQLLNLVYDATPSDYISMIITDYGMIPTSSVPVIVREYGREHLFI